jgi:prepilin-type N-terminal cleavage/methylation domain-containing protein
VKKRSAFTFVEILVGIAISGILIAILIWGSMGTSRETDVGWIATLRTIEHDGRKFVTITKSGGGAGVIHHPRCPCLEVALAENCE